MLKLGAAALAGALVLFTLFATATSAPSRRNPEPARSVREPGPPASSAPKPPKLATSADAGVEQARSNDRILIDVGDPSERRFLGAGFSADEGEPGSNATWSDGDASKLTLPLERADGAYRLSLHAHAFAPLGTVSVRVQVNGKAAGSLEVTSALATQTLDLPPGILQLGKNELTFTYSKTGSPREMTPGSKDDRQVAVRYDWIRLEPARP